MSISNLLFVISAIQILLLSTPALADPDATAQVLKRELQYTQGILHADVKSLAAVFADTFVDTSESGHIRGKQQMLKLIGQQTPPKFIRESDRKIQIYGDTAVVTVRFEGEVLDGGKPYKFAGRATDVWVKQGNDWYCVAAHSSPIAQ